jgi:ketosteroid isomerase-like protein
MSQQNVEVVKRLIAAIMRRDLDAFMEGATPDVEFVTLMTDLEGSLHGREGIGTFMDNVHATVDDPAFSVEDFRDLGDAVLALGRMEGTYTARRRADRCAPRGDLRFPRRQGLAHALLPRSRRGVAGGRTVRVGDVRERGPSNMRTDATNYVVRELP